MTESVAATQQDTTISDEARRALAKVYAMLIDLAQKKTADREDPARNQASKSADPDTTPANPGAAKGAVP